MSAFHYLSPSFVTCALLVGVFLENTKAEDEACFLETMFQKVSELQAKVEKTEQTVLDLTRELKNEKDNRMNLEGYVHYLANQLTQDTTPSNPSATLKQNEISKIATESENENCSTQNTGQVYLQLSVDNPYIILCSGSSWKFVNVADPPSSCKELYDSGLNGSQYTQSYLLNDGAGGTPYKTYCDMSSDGGGWTLVARAQGQTTEWAPASQSWSNNVLIAPDTADNVSAMSSMKNKGWLNINGQKLKVCYDGPHTDCAVFTHNLGIPLSQLFVKRFRVAVTENYTFRTLRAAFNLSSSVYRFPARAQWCGLNLGKCGGRTICRIGCIGDFTASSDVCGMDDYALGIGVSSCFDNHGCDSVGTSTNNLHYRDRPNHGVFLQTAFIYVQ